MVTITEPDWKAYKKICEVARDRLYAKLLDELTAIATNQNKPADDRFWEIDQFIKESRKDIDSAFGRFSRSEALLNLAIMRNYGLVTDEEVKSFSEGTQEFLARVASLSE